MTYSSTLAMNRQRLTTKNQNTTSFRAQEHAIGPISNTIILIMLTCLLGLLYLTQVTKTNSFSYQINGLQQQESQLKNERAELEVAAARLQSLSRVKDSQVAKNLVAATPAGIVQN